MKISELLSLLVILLCLVFILLYSAWYLPVEALDKRLWWKYWEDEP